MARVGFFCPSEKLDLLKTKQLNVHLTRKRAKNSPFCGFSRQAGNAPQFHFMPEVVGSSGGRGQGEAGKWLADSWLREFEKIKC
jgi:hypothetical protein